MGVAKEREWCGGAYERREGIVVAADKDGIVIGGWYDGTADLEVEARLSWAEIEDLKAEVEA